MPIAVRKSGSKYIVTDGKKTFGSHTTKMKAERQRRAIEANKRR